MPTVFKYLIQGGGGGRLVYEPVHTKGQNGVVLSLNDYILSLFLE